MWEVTHRYISYDKSYLSLKVKALIVVLYFFKVVVELRNLCEQAETVKAEREVIETELKGAKSEMTDKFTQVNMSLWLLTNIPL